jgi:hypothetical protein
MNQLIWCSPLGAAIYQLLADIIKLGLAKKLIQKKDLFTTDQIVINKLKKDPKTAKEIKKLFLTKIKLVTKTQADCHILSKIRAVDPYFLRDGRLTKLSKVDKNYVKKIRHWKKMAQKGFYIKILNS